MYGTSSLEKDNKLLLLSTTNLQLYLAMLAIYVWYLEQFFFLGGEGSTKFHNSRYVGIQKSHCLPFSSVPKPTITSARLHLRIELLSSRTKTNFQRLRGNKDSCTDMEPHWEMTLFHKNLKNDCVPPKNKNDSVPPKNINDCVPPKNKNDFTPPKKMTVFHQKIKMTVFHQNIKINVLSIGSCWGQLMLLFFKTDQ